MKKIELQKSIVTKTEESIKEQLNDVKYMKGDLKVFKKISELIASLPTNTEAEFIVLIDKFAAETEENITTIEDSIAGIKESLRTEKQKLSKLERLQKEIDDLTVEEVNTDDTENTTDPVTTSEKQT